MANGSVAQAINRQTVAAAIRQARIDAAHHQAWVTATNKAAVELEASSWAFDGDTLRIASRTTPGARYTVTPDGCECRAGQATRPCWHRAAWRLLRKAAEIVQAQPVTLTFEEMQALVDELYA